MKKIVALFLTLVMIFSFTVSACAYNEPEYNIVYSSTEYFEDGSSLETVIAEATSETTTYGLTTYYKDGYKTLTSKNSDGEVEWSATVYGSFEYTNFNCSCTASLIEYSIINNKWKIPSATSTESGNKAIGYVTAKYYVLGVNTKTVNKTITLTCSATGVLS